jgi:hypothetical protein
MKDLKGKTTFATRGGSCVGFALAKAFLNRQFPSE